MTYDKILALLAALGGAEPDPEAAFGASATGGHDPAFPVSIQACRHPLGRDEVESGTVLCGSVSVPVDHAVPGGPRLDIAFTLLKAQSTYPAPDPLVHLHDGPGSATGDTVESHAGLFAPWRRTRDILVLDHRAARLSGRSPTCYAAFVAGPEGAGHGYGDAVSAAGLGRRARDCFAELKAEGLPLADFNTHQNARDTRAIVGTLGYKSYNIYAVSYGTTVALEIMRSVPEGLRAVILDGVLPPSVRQYDLLSLPPHEAIVRFLDECRTTADCNEAHPELAAELERALDNAADGQLMLDGVALPPETIPALFGQRDGDTLNASYTPLIPAILEEMAAGGAMPTLAALLDRGFALPRTDPDAVRAGLAELSAEQKRFVEVAIAEAEALRRAEAGLATAIAELRASLRRDRTLSPLAALLDAEIWRAGHGWNDDPELSRSVLMRLASLRAADPAKDTLQQFVQDHFPPMAVERLLAVIDAMTSVELHAAFEVLRQRAEPIEPDLSSNRHLWLYGCQEARPYNSPEGWAAANAELRFPQVAGEREPLMRAFFSACEALDAAPREGFHEPVSSAVPTLSIGSSWDTRTAASWALVAVETLENGQGFIIPEAGHGALLYQSCVADMGVAFIDDPMRALGTHCPESAAPAFAPATAE